MMFKHSFLGLIATAALISATGCGKQESPATPAVEKTTSVQPSAEKPQVVDNTPKTPAVVPTIAPKTEAVATTSPASVTSPIAATPPVESKPASVPPSTLQSSFQAQKLAVSQAVTNQVQALASTLTNQVLATLGSTNSTSTGATNPLPSVAASATNQWQALATAVTNRTLAALGMTNLTTTATNQVEALLEKAKILSSNQKYQEALNTVTQLYNTKLTPEQKQKADDLKAQIQASLTQKATTEASSVLGGLIGGKK